MPAVFVDAWTLVSLVLQAQTSAPSVDPVTPWAQFGLAGLCLATVGLFAKQTVDRERARADQAVALLTNELLVERARNEKEQARIIAQRDGLIQEFFKEALPALSRVNDVLAQRQQIDEQLIAGLRESSDVMQDVRRLMEART